MILPATDPLAVPSVVAAYAGGYFVMDDAGPEGLRFESPPERAVLPIDSAAIERWKTKRRSPFPNFEYRVDSAFEQVLIACAAPRENDLEPFMTPRVLEMYRDLHRAGFAHSVEAWTTGDAVPVGGVLLVALGRAAMLETMFHRVSGAGNATLIATLDLVAKSGCELCDVQYGSDHLTKFGTERITREEYTRRLRLALRPTTATEPDLESATPDETVAEFAPVGDPG